MNAAIMESFKRGRFIHFVKALGVTLAFSFLLSGCATSSPDDDYVASVLAEAMQDGSAGNMQSDETGVAPVKAEGVRAPVSIATPPVSVSIAKPPASVSIATPPSSISIAVPPVVAVPAARGAVAQQTTPVVKTIPAVVEPEPIVPAASVPSTVVPHGETAIPAPASVQSSGETTNKFATGPVISSVADLKSGVPKPSIATIQPDSIVWISVSEDPSLSGRYMVNDASAIDFGYVGLVFLPDLSVEQAEAEIKRVLEGRYLKNATVSVKLAKASYDRVSVHGTVEMPGEIKIGPGATISLNEALRRAGGLRSSRENSRVKIVRGGAKTPFGAAAEGDIFPLMSESGQLKVPDIFLRNDDLAYVFTPSTEVKGQNGDSVMTGMGGKRVILLGEVPRRGVIEFSENEPCTLMYLLFKIGGLPRFARGNKISVVRRDKDGQEKKFTVDGEKLMKTGKPEDDLVLETGDRIVVPARSISFL